ncbi:MAG: pseudouridine synthase [Bacteroidetes bacterium]|nr:MAG: pseudouridine synthase [Bacteroidota bacterium]
MRLNRYIAHCGVCARRDADTLIEQGEVMVDGQVVTTLGTKITPAEQEVVCKGKVLKVEHKVYILMNKPKDCFCTLEDPNAGRTVLDIIAGACSERVYPVGRLDRNTTGLLLMTNDGELTEQLTHPSYAKSKIYEVGLDRNVSQSDMEQLLQGVETEVGFVRVDSVDYTRPDDRSVVGVELHSGQNRVVRRIFEALGYKVVKLDRVYYAGLTKKNLPRGEWRFLEDEEITMLKMGRYH